MRGRALAITVTVAALGASAVGLDGGGGGSRAAATAVEAVSVADATVASGAPNTNAGSALRLNVCTGCAGTTNVKRAYVRIDVAGVGGPVASASLRVWAAAGPVPQITAATTSNAWDESTITWRNAPAPGPSVGTSAAGAAKGWYDVPLTSSTVTGDGTYSFVLTTADPTVLRLGAREDAAYAPRLVLDVDVPHDPVVAAAGDIAPRCTGTGCAHYKSAQLVAAIDPDAVLVLGDAQYPEGALADYRTYYASTWGAFLDRTRPVPGNHDYRADTTAGGYFGYFGAAAGDPARGYYSYDLGSWHVVALNTNYDCRRVACGAGSAQEQWLRADLAATTQPCVLAYWHHPRWSSGTEHGSSTISRALWDDLYAAGADVVLNGHEHNYERFVPQSPAGVADAAGIREFVVGTGGGALSPLGTRLATSASGTDTARGVLELTLHASSYDWRFVPVAGSTFSDAGSATCH